VYSIEVGFEVISGDFDRRNACANSLLQEWRETCSPSLERAMSLLTGRLKGIESD